MEERQLRERFVNLFTETMPIMQNIKKGFLAENLETVRENKISFKEIVKKRVPAVQKIIDSPEKTEQQKQFLILLPSFQMIGVALENLIDKMETKLQLKILFSEKAIAEIKELYTILEKQFRDIKDYVSTGNPTLKTEVKSDWEKIYKLIDEYAVFHQNRLITGVCVPQASYLYLDIVDSIKRTSRGLLDFIEKV